MCDMLSEDYYDILPFLEDYTGRAVDGERIAGGRSTSGGTPLPSTNGTYGLGGRTRGPASECTSRPCYSSVLLEEMACVAWDDGNVDTGGCCGGRVWCLMDLTTCGRTC